MCCCRAVGHVNLWRRSSVGRLLCVLFRHTQTPIRSILCCSGQYLSSLQAFILPTPTPSAARGETASSATAASASRLDFLRSARAVVTAAAGAALLPKASGAQVFTDDALGLKFEVSSSSDAFLTLPVA